MTSEIARTEYFVDDYEEDGSGASGGLIRSALRSFIRLDAVRNDLWVLYSGGVQRQLRVSVCVCVLCQCYSF